MNRVKGDPIEEWKMAVTLAQHFNDLLLRVRAFGLPLITTVAGAGFALGLRVEIRHVDEWIPAAGITGNGVLVTALLFFLLWRKGWGVAPARAEHVALQGNLQFWEKNMWWCVGLVACAWVIAFWSLVWAGEIDIKASRSYSAAPIVLFFGLAVVISLYALDRFYYYKLLMGAVSRASELEQELGFRLTDTITNLTAPGQSATIVTLLYFLPGMKAYFLLLIFVVLNPAAGQFATPPA